MGCSGIEYPMMVVANIGIFPHPAGRILSQGVVACIPDNHQAREAMSEQNNNTQGAESGEQSDSASRSKKGPKSVSRVAAFKTLNAVLLEGAPLEDALSRARKPIKDSRDKAFHRQLVMTVLRHHGELSSLLATFINREPKGQALAVLTVLKIGMAQALFLDVPVYAAASTSVDLVRRVGFSGHAKMVNAIMRRTAAEGDAHLAKMNATQLNTPEWLMASWVKAYGEETANAIAAANLREPSLDLTVKSDPAHWAEAVGGVVLPTGSVRLRQSGPVEALPGFKDGEWWVQDAAATLPARLLGDVNGLRVADICSAPGGKTAQLVVSGGIVTSVDRSADRMKRLNENLKRLNLTAETVIADATEWRPEKAFDAVLVDAPCTATGTLRRHPDIALNKSSRDVASMVRLQASILDNAIHMVRPGGKLVFCTCSLQPEEGPDLVAALLARQTDVSLSPISPDDVHGMTNVITDKGYLRTLPHQGEEWGNWDGFFAARFLIG